MRLLAATSCALILLVAGCGGEEEAPPTAGPADLLAAAVTNADEAASYESEVELTSDLQGSDFRVSGTTLSSADSSTGRAELEYSQQGESFPMESVTVDGTSYLRSPQFESLLPDGKEWVRSETGQSLTTDQFVDLLRDSPGVREVGGETIRGTPTTRLRGPVDVQEMLQRAGGGAAAEVTPQQLERMNAQADVWISEGEEEIQRIAMTLTVDGEEGALRMTGDVLGYGVPLDDIEAPAERLVADESELQG